MSNIRRDRIDADRLNEAIRTLKQNYAEAFEGDHDLLLDTLEGETDLEPVIATLITEIGLDEGRVLAIKQTAADLDIRAKRFETRAGVRRALIMTALETAGVQTIETPTGTVTTRTNPPKLIVKEEADIPANYWTPGKPKLDRKKLLDDLKAGSDIPGAEQSNGGTSLTIRRK